MFSAQNLAFHIRTGSSSFFFFIRATNFKEAVFRTRMFRKSVKRLCQKWS